MLRAVLPRHSASEHWLLTGIADLSGSGSGREDIIEEDEIELHPDRLESDEED